MGGFFMRKKVENTLTITLIILILPCVLSFLLNDQMEKIYRSIQDEAAYISVKTNQGIQEMNMEEYIIGVTATQIPLTYELEAIKAQMVIARTNLFYEMEQGQAWEGDYLTLAELESKGVANKFLQAQKETKGEYLTYQGKRMMASFHALSAGKTRDGKEAFMSDGYEYLQSRNCPADEKAPDYQSVVQIAENWRGLEIVQRDSAGYVQQLNFKETYFSGEEFRRLFGLPSSNFTIQENEEGIFLTVLGIGHGLGLSQYTAQQLALSGKGYREILQYFFEGVEIVR